jgi:hypothetical protein
MDEREENRRDAEKDEDAFPDPPSARPRTPAQVTEDAQRERLIALLSWWSGWCTDHDDKEPELAKLGGLLLDAKHRIALDRRTVR